MEKSFSRSPLLLLILYALDSARAVEPAESVSSSRADVAPRCVLLCVSLLADDAPRCKLLLDVTDSCALDVISVPLPNRPAPLLSGLNWLQVLQDVVVEDVASCWWDMDIARLEGRCNIKE